MAEMAEITLLRKGRLRSAACPLRRPRPRNELAGKTMDKLSKGKANT